MLFLKKGKKLFSFGVLLVILLLSGCDGGEKTVESNYYLSLSGESESWKVDSYEILIKPETFDVGNGNVTMKNKTEFSTDFFSIGVYAVIDNKDTVIQRRSVTGSESDISETSMGATEGGTLLNENGEPVSLENISDIYMIIEWKDNKKTKEEKVDLFNKEGLLN
ncbi:hypothetical protein [Oceanobacillus senegalensis]|uniref:hypothetical protein n=1 Tax=Oceanobacillus senegalensis TaxID=1936063 RepID=UPI001FE2BD71|nr:hypothetical protein [Oceanobacillus senegalensis]